VRIELHGFFGVFWQRPETREKCPDWCVNAQKVTKQTQTNLLTLFPASDRALGNSERLSFRFGIQFRGGSLQEILGNQERQRIRPAR
jgi:hypothetical protein